MDSSKYRKDLYTAYSHFCSIYSENTLFIFEGRELTYGKSMELATRRAAFIQQQGYGKNSIIGLMAVNSPDWCITFMAITMTGALVLPLDTNLQPAQVNDMLESAGADAVFTSPAFAAYAEKIPVYRVSLEEDLAPLEDFKPAELSYTDRAAMLFTSGTTGKPKMVQLTHLNLINVAGVCSELEEFSPDDMTFALLPLFHIYALEATFLAPLASGGKIMMLNSLKGPDIMKALSEYPITIFPAAPLMWELFFKALVSKLGVGSPKYYFFMFFVKYAPILKGLGLGFLVKRVFSPVHDAFGRSHRFFISGGAPLKTEYFKYFKNMGFNFMEGYGLSETTGPISIPYYKKTIAGSVGTPIPGNEVRIKNINEDGIGEIWFKGDAVMLGYYKNDAANREVFDDEGFFNTGDLGRLDAKGNIFVTGRMKNVIVLDSGKKAYPEELEFYFKQSHLISEIAVIDRIVQGHVQIYAVIVPEVNGPNVYSMIKKEMKILNKGLPEYRRIWNFAISIDELPKNSTRKILYRDVKKLLDEGAYQTDETDSAVLKDVLKPSNIREEQIVSLLKKRLGESVLYSNQTINDFGVDSLGLIDLMTALEEELHIGIDVEEILKKQNMAEMLQYIASIEPGDGKSLDERILRGPITRKPRSFFNPLYHVVLAVIGVLARIFWRVKIYNREKIVLDNSILIANHQSYLDIIWISFCIPRKYRKNVYVTGKKRFSYLRFVAPVFPILFLDDNNSVEVLKANADLLRLGKSLFIFPEGTRSADGDLHSFKSGAAYLGKHLNKTIIPMGVSGAWEIWPRSRRFPKLFSSVRGKIRVGDPIDPKDFSSVESLNEAMEQAVSGLVSHPESEKKKRRAI